MYPKDYKTGDEDGNCYPDTRGHGGNSFSQDNVKPDRNYDNENLREYFNRNHYIDDSVKKSPQVYRENDVRDYFQNKKAKKVHPLVKFIIYGDVDEIPHDILGEELCSDYINFDEEQMLRFSIACAVQAYFEGKLHKNGYLFDEKLHKPQDLIK